MGECFVSVGMLVCTCVVVREKKGSECSRGGEAREGRKGGRKVVEGKGKECKKGKKEG